MKLAVNPAEAFTEEGVVCAICGRLFLRITPKHLRMHGLTLKEYLELCGYPPDTKLSYVRKKTCRTYEELCVAYPELVGAPRRAVKEKSVVCLICGKRFKSITSGHLAKHGLTLAEYRLRCGFGRGGNWCRALLRRARQAGRNQ